MKVHISVLREYLAEHYLDFLFEGRVDDVREQYPDIEDDIWDSLVAQQPAGSNNKYLQWSAKQVDDGTMPEEIIMALRLFHDNIQRLKQKDINQYADVDALNIAVDELHKNKTKSQEAKQAKSDTQTIYSDDTWLVVRPFTTEASQKYGAGSKWCISATASRNYFNQYSVNNNKFYFVINKKVTDNSPNSKFAIAIVAAGLAASGREIQVYDAVDKLVNISVVASTVGAHWPGIWAKIQEHVKAYPKTREVEDAERASEELVAALLRGEKLGETGLKKVAKDGQLTTPVIKALLAHYKDYNGPTDYRDTRSEIISSLSSRISEMPGDAALLVMKWVGSTKPAESGAYWSGKYYLDNMYKNANLNADNFRELAVGASEEVLACIFSNPSAPEDLKQEIAAKVHEFKDDEAQRKITWELVKSGKITAEQLQNGIKSKKGGYNYVLNQILSNPTEVNLSPDLIRLIPIKTASEFKQLMMNRKLPPDYAVEILMNLMASNSLNKKDLYQILRVVPLDTTQVEKLWADKSTVDVRTALLQNPGIGSANASKFAKSKNSSYRFAIAHNSIASAEDLAALAGDESVSTRAAVGANPNASVELLTKLAKDEATAVRANVAANASAPPAVLQGLKRDSDGYVRKSAIKTLKSLNQTEALILHLMGMGGLLTEEMSDDEDEDIMNPSWREISARTMDTYEFIAVFLLQNNGSASREEIQDAWQDWTGYSGAKELWSSTKYSEEVIRGLTAGGKGWYWSPAGTAKGALFRLTPVGAAGAMAVLRKHRHRGMGAAPTQIGSAQAKPGKNYFTQSNNDIALDVTGYERGVLTVEEVVANRNGEPAVDHLGKYSKLAANRSRKHRWSSRGVKIFKYTSPAGEVKQIPSFPKVNLPRNTEVTFIKSMYGLTGPDNSQANLAIVRHGEKFLLVPFPLWAASEGAPAGAREPNVAPPVKKSPAAGAAPAPAAAAEPGAEPAAPAGPRGPKTTYKIYGKFKGHPVATRLKGQAYVGPANTQFAGGEQAVISPEDGKLRVKKSDGDHSQLWEPVEG